MIEIFLFSYYFLLTHWITLLCGIMDISLVTLQSVLIWKTQSTSGAEKGHDGAGDTRRLLQVNLLDQIKLIFLT